MLDCLLARYWESQQLWNREKRCLICALEFEEGYTCY